MKNKRSLIVRIVAIALCALLVLGIATAALSAFAADLAQPMTGSRDMKQPIILAVVAVVLIAVCVIVPRLVKKNDQ